MAKRKYTADEALELIFADNDSAEDFGSSSEDDVSSENENILEQSDQYCNNSVNLLDKESINDCVDCGAIRTNENISQKCDDNIVEFDFSSDSKKRADTNVVHVVTILVFVQLRAFVIITRNNT